MGCGPASPAAGKHQGVHSLQGCSQPSVCLRGMQGMLALVVLPAVPLEALLRGSRCWIRLTLAPSMRTSMLRFSRQVQNWYFDISDMMECQWNICTLDKLQGPDTRVGHPGRYPQVVFFFRFSGWVQGYPGRKCCSVPRHGPKARGVGTRAGLTLLVL